MVLTPFRLLQITCFTSDSLKCFPYVATDFFEYGNFSPALPPPPLAAGPFPLALQLFLPSVFHFTQLCVGPFNSFW